MTTTPRLLTIATTLLALSTVNSFAAEAPKVTVSIKPLHSLVAAVMDGVGEPQLIIKGAASPHTYSLRPSDARMLEDSDIVFWGGHELERFLEKPLEEIARNAKSVELLDAEGVEILQPREGGDFEAHDHGHEHEHEHDAHDAEDESAHEHNDHEVDPHFWLNPENARAAAKSIALTLAETDPDHASAYHANLAALDQRLVDLDKEMQQRTGALTDSAFVVFHDAYQYFEHRYGLHASGSITISPDAPPSAAHIQEVEDKLKRLGTVCIFTEPQFEPRLAQRLAEGAGVKTGILDPIGADIPAGPEMYEMLIERIGDSLEGCLAHQ